MGAGKTTLGKALSRDLGVEFIDLDWYIESRFRRTINELFAERGEEGFREIERNMLHEVGEFEDVVIACGGGTPCFFDNMDYMNGQGETFYLEVSVDVLFRRLRTGTARRPILRNKSDEELPAFIADALSRRLPFYLKARHHIDGGRLESKRQIRETIEQVKSILQTNKQP